MGSHWAVRLGGLHIEISFWALYKHLMAGSGIKDLLELVYSSNAVIHMLSGKAISRAIRGHLLDAVLNNAHMMMMMLRMMLLTHLTPTKPDLASAY